MRKIKIIAIALVLSLVVIRCSKTNGSKWVATVKAPSSVSDGTVAYLYTYDQDNDKNVLVDSTNVSAGEFKLSGISEEGISKYAVSIQGLKPVNLYVRNGNNIFVTLTTKPYEDVYQGSPLQEDYMMVQNTDLSYFKFMQGLQEKYMALITANDTEGIQQFQQQFQQKSDSILAAKTEVFKKVKDKEFLAHYILEDLYVNPSKEYAEKLKPLFSEDIKDIKTGMYLYDIFDHFTAFSVYQASNRMSAEQLSENYNTLTPEDKESIFGIKLQKLQEKRSSIAIGQSAPNIVSKNTNGELVDLQKIKSKLVLLDFWASWCGPCRVENHNYIKIYNKYKSKGFEILGYTLDTDRDKWLGAIKEDELPWLQVEGTLSPKEGQEIIKTYMLQSIPTNFLLLNGKIIGVNKFGEDLEQLIQNNI